MNLDGYFERIGYTGSVANDLSTLRGIAFAHATSIPFEGLDPLSGVPVSLDMDALEDKLVRRQRGGYCFEQNLIVALLNRDGTRYGVRNNAFFHRRGAEVLTQVEIQNREQLCDILDGYFGLELPLTADLSSLFD